MGMETTNKAEKKKILIFVPEFPVLTETFIERDISKLIQNDKLDISILAMKKGSGSMTAVVEKHFSKSRLTILDSFMAGFFFITKPGLTFKAYRLVLKDKSKSLLGRIYLFLKSVGYTKVFQKHHPDEIHAHFLSDPSTIAMVASIILQIPFSINAHARDVTEYPTLPGEKIKNAKFVSVCNSNAYNKILRLAQPKGSETFEFAGNLASKIKLIRHGIDENEIFSVPLELKKAARPMIISGGTRLVAKKGLEYLIGASEILKKRGISHELHITGPGNLYGQLTDMLKKRGLEDMVFIHGDGKGVPFSLISQYYRVADVLVLPSIDLDSGDADGIPNALIEASLAKLAIVTTDAGSITELIETGVNGILVPQKNSEAIATEIEKLIFDENKRHELGENAYKKAKEMFDTEKNAGELANLFIIN